MASIKRTNHHWQHKKPTRYSSNKELISIKPDGELIVITNKNKDAKTMIRNRKKDSDLDFCNRMESSIGPVRKQGALIKKQRSAVIKTCKVDSDVRCSTSKRDIKAITTPRSKKHWAKTNNIKNILNIMPMSTIYNTRPIVDSFDLAPFNHHIANVPNT